MHNCDTNELGHQEIGWRILWKGNFDLGYPIVTSISESFPFPYGILYENLSQRLFFPNRVNPVSFLEGGGLQADVYTSRGRKSVTGFQFHSKSSMDVVDFRQIYNTYTRDWRFITITVIHTSRTILKSHFFAQFKRRFLVHIISAYPPSLTQKSEFYMIFFNQRFISSC